MASAASKPSAVLMVPMFVWPHNRSNTIKLVERSSSAISA
jgi:hypothetical protein